MSRILTGLISIAFIMASLAYAAHAEEKGWKSTGLEFRDLKHWVSNKKCHKSGHVFIACVQALNAMAAMGSQEQGPPLRLMFATAQQTSKGGLFELADAMEYYEGLSLVSLYPLAQEHRDFKELFRSYLSGVARAYEEGLRVDFAEILSDLKARYVKTDNEAVLVGTSINEYLRYFYDPHTTFWVRTEFQKKVASDGEEYGGIGLQTAPEVRGQRVIGFLGEDSPAYRAGLRRHDVLIRVNGIAIRGMTEERIAHEIRGKVDTDVRLNVLRRNAVYDFSIKREKIEISNVEKRILVRAGEKIGYIQVRSFMSGTTCAEVVGAMAVLEANGVQGLILDLRGNLGGQVAQAVCVAEVFLRGGQLVTYMTSIESDRETMRYTAREKLPMIFGREARTELPLVTLIDDQSASGSELLAGALQDHGRSWLVGDRSYGKGIQQSSRDIPDGLWLDSKLKKLEQKLEEKFNLDLDFNTFPLEKLMYMKTTDRFHLPSGRCNQLEGITPDFKVPPAPGLKDGQYAVFREEDLPGAVSASPSPTQWVRQRPQESSWIDDCVAKTGKADKIFAEDSDRVFPADFRLLVAEDVLRCSGLAPLDIKKLEMLQRGMVEEVLKMQFNENLGIFPTTIFEK